MAKEFVCHSCKGGYSNEPFARINSVGQDPKTGNEARLKREYCEACYHGEFAVMFGQLMQATMNIAAKLQEEKIDMNKLLLRPPGT